MGRSLALAACIGALFLAACAWKHGGLEIAARHVMGTAPFGGPEPTPKPRPDPAWVACHEEHVQLIRDADEAAEGFQLMFFGDSITESWAGTDLCHPVERARGVKEVLQRNFGRFNPAVMAVGGDQTAHLLWRIRNGEVPRVHTPKVAVLLIGTNDLGAAAWDAGSIHTAEQAVMQAVPGVTLRVLQTLHMLKDLLPETHIILMALLPRASAWPGAKDYHWPSIFARPFDIVNAHFRDYAALDGYLHFLDCGERFLTPSHRAIRPDLMPDGLHPNAAGYELLAECLDPLVVKLIQRYPKGSTSSTTTTTSTTTNAEEAAAQSWASNGGKSSARARDSVAASLEQPGRVQVQREGEGEAEGEDARQE